ncbi:MAG: hypothetical protein Fur006_65510 [Coleofasciculaceae cyanobacterium]
MPFIYSKLGTLHGSRPTFLRKILLPQFPIPDSQFPIPDSQFPIPDSRFPIPDSEADAAKRVFPISRLSTPSSGTFLSQWRL